MGCRLFGAPQPNMPLKSRVATIIDYSDFDNFIKEIYGHDFESQQAELWSNDASYRYNIRSKEELDGWHAPILQKFIEHGNPEEGIVRTLLQDLVNRDLLPPGEYYIAVSW